MDIVVGFDTFFVRANQVWIFQLEIAIFRILFKTQIHDKFAFPTVQKNSQQRKSYQIKILHLYLKRQPNVHLNLE